MKKIISIISLFFIITLQLNAQNSVVVSAVVGNQNQAPVVLSVNPSSDPKILQKNKTQAYRLYFKDTEKDNVTYTITPDNGYTNPISGTINSSSYDTNSGAYINFIYLAPANSISNEKITITLNDSSNVVVKQLNLYIY